jgi:TonB-dependent receptor
MSRIYSLIPLLLAAEVMAQGSSTLVGRVNGPQGPLPSAEVSVLCGSVQKRALTDIQGQFRLDGLPEGACSVSANYSGLDEVKMDAQASANPTQIQLVLNERIAELATMRVSSTMRQNQAKAQMMQKNSPRIVSVVAADHIGKLPDRNAAEAVQRIPGASIERDQGEGRFVAVRGLPSEWSAATLNGDRIPVAEEETLTRATSMDFFPTDMIQFVEVSKALTPDVEGDAMGGSINFITRTAPEKRTMQFSLGGGFNQKAEGKVGSFNALYGDRLLDQRLGFIINGTWWNRDWATDNFEPRRAGNFGVKRLELRDYTGNRDTRGLNGGAEFKFDENNKIMGRLQYGKITDDELHIKHRFRFDKKRVELQHIHNILTTEYIGGDFGGEHQMGDRLKLDWKAGRYDNTFYYGDIPNSDNRSYYVVRFDQPVTFVGTGRDSSGKIVDSKYVWNTVDGGLDAWNEIGTHLADSTPIDPAKMKFKVVNMYKVDINERDNFVGSFNLNYKATDALQLKVGAKYRDKKRSSVFADEYWYANSGTEVSSLMLNSYNLQDQPGKADFLSDYTNQYDAVLAPSKVMKVEDIDGFWNKYQSQLKMDPNESMTIRNGLGAGRNLTVEEKHIIGYGMGTWDFSPEWSLIAGLQANQTLAKISGYRLEQSDAAKTTWGVATSYDKDYLALLPMAHLKFSPDRNMNLRAAVTRTFSRPSFGSMSPGGTFNDWDMTYIYGNTDLNPTYSMNYDLMAEKYFTNTSMIGAGAFFKQIADPVYMAKREDSIWYAGVKEAAKFVQPRNSTEEATLWGVEANGSLQFTFLPSFLSGFGVDANYTFMQSTVTVGEGRESRLPRQANHIFNSAIFFDKYGAGARLAMNYKGDYIMEHGESSQEDLYYGKYLTMDLQTSYQFGKRVTWYLELNNLLNEPMIYFLGNKERPEQVEYYGVRGQTGVKVNLF